MYKYDLIFGVGLSCIVFQVLLLGCALYVTVPFLELSQMVHVTLLDDLTLIRCQEYDSQDHFAC
jgi:hypothetical protein